MPLFTSHLIQVSKTSEKYMSLTHGPEGAITMFFKDFYSHFGLAYNKKFKNYSIGINISDKFNKKLRVIESKATTLLGRPLTKPLLRALVEKGEYRTLYLKPQPERFEENMIDEKAVMVSGVITVAAIYLNETPAY